MVVQKDPSHDTQKTVQAFPVLRVCRKSRKFITRCTQSWGGIIRLTGRFIIHRVCVNVKRAERTNQLCYDRIYALFVSPSSCCSVESGAVVVVVLPLAGCLAAVDAPPGTPPPVVAGRPSSSRSSAKS